MPKVSVLMPIFNTDETFLRTAIESVLEQSFRDFEFLIINDSPNNTKLDNIVASYKDERIKYKKNQQNLGISTTRNLLIDWASGEYLAVMDHDDISLPERFLKEVKFLDTNLDVGVVSCATQIYNKNRVKKYPTDDHAIKLALISSCALIHSASMIRKSVLTNNNLRYEAEFSPAEDYALWCRLIQYTKFHNLPEVLFIYRKHNHRTSVLMEDKMQAKTLAIQAFVVTKYPTLFHEYTTKSIKITKIKLFGLITLISIKKLNDISQIWLLGFIPFLQIKRKQKFNNISD